MFASCLIERGSLSYHPACIDRRCEVGMEAQGLLLPFGNTHNLTFYDMLVIADSAQSG